MRRFGALLVDRAGQVLIETFLWITLFVFICLGFHRGLREEYQRFKNTFTPYSGRATSLKKSTFKGE